MGYIHKSLYLVLYFMFIVVTKGFVVSVSGSSRVCDVVATTSLSSTSNDGESTVNPDINVLLVECGFGNDSHGQDATKAAKRACRNAIEFNSISIKKIVPGGYDAMKLNVILAVPNKYQDTLNLDEVATVFPYGTVNFEVQDGGMVAPSGRIIESLGDKNDDMLIVCAAVQVGY